MFLKLKKIFKKYNISTIFKEVLFDITESMLLSSFNNYLQCANFARVIMCHPRQIFFFAFE